MNLFNWSSKITIASLIVLFATQPLQAKNQWKQKLESPAKTVRDWLAQFDRNRETIAIFGVRIKPTEGGLEVILETKTGQLFKPILSRQGKILSTEIANAVLTLTDDREFKASNPTIGIESVIVTQIQPDRVRLEITGTEQAPEAIVSSRNNELVFGLKTVATETETEITVTAQKKPEPQQRVPISLTTIPKQQLEDAQINSFEAIASNTPNFSFFPTTAGSADFNY
jgi:iron complex outermembrane receptor protein